MSTMKAALVIVGILVILAGIVMSLQGFNVIGGSALMSGNPTYIYVGAVVAVVGLVIAVLGFKSKKATPAPSA